MATQIKEVEKKDGVEGKRFAVRLDPQHPAGQYQRAGVKFIVGETRYFDVVPDVMLKDPWLMVAKIEGDTPPVFNTYERRAKQPERRL